MPSASRREFLAKLFLNEVPRLWCPPLTHYDAHGTVDANRMAAHLRHLAPSVRGFLIPGSTGDGWELSMAERRQVLSIGLEHARELNTRILIGALHPDTAQALKLIRDDVEWLKSRTDEQDALAALTKSQVCGFTICPPRGKHLTQQQMSEGLAAVLELELPTAIYQLPQVTFNEMSPDLVADLALQYQNFILLKDTSGSDVVALSGKNFGGVVALRGAEGDYVRWLKPARGPYDGFLLSSANCFAPELAQIISDVSAARFEAAQGLSQRISTVVAETFRLAADVPWGNAFANGNKALDHFFAFGPKAPTAPTPRLHAGPSLPLSFIQSVGQILLRAELMPTTGYLMT